MIDSRTQGPTPPLATSSPAVSLVGDIGGTNCRLALASVSNGVVSLTSPRSLKCADFACVEQAIDLYLAGMGREGGIAAAVMAIAGPVNDGMAVSTNGDWRLSEAALRAHGFPIARLVNDYTALALAVDHLADADVAHIGPRLRGDPRESIAVLGAGTGLGVGALARGLGTQTAIATEGGHVAFAPTDEIEIDIFRLLSERFGRVSVERILSGSGLTNLRWALARIGDMAADPLSPEEIVGRGQAGDPLCAEVLQRFCAIYGSVAGDIALTFGARGGVFLGGGIAAGMVAYLQASDFRRRFEAKGRFQPYLAAIPTRIILHGYAALMGSASIADRALSHPD